MRTLVIVASVAVLAASNVACDSSRRGSNSSNNVLPFPSVISPTMLEAKGGNGGGNGNGNGGGKVNENPTPASLTLVMVADANADGPNWGDSVRFDFSTDATTEPRVSLSCSQDGDVVLGAQTPTPFPWTLATSSWQGGAAACTAKLYYFDVTKVVELTSISFTAGG